MIEVLASSYELFLGDFLFFGVLGALAWARKKKEEEDFYG